MTIAMIALTISTDLAMQIISCFVIVRAPASAGSRCLLGLIGFVIVQHMHEYHARKPAHNVVSFCSNSRLREFPEDDLTGRFNAFSEHGVEHDLPTEVIEGLLECFVEV